MCERSVITTCYGCYDPEKGKKIVCDRAIDKPDKRRIQHDYSQFPQVFNPAVIVDGSIESCILTPGRKLLNGSFSLMRKG